MLILCTERGTLSALLYMPKGAGAKDPGPWE